MPGTAFIAGVQEYVDQWNFGDLAKTQIDFELARNPNFSKANQAGIINGLKTLAGVSNPFDKVVGGENSVEVSSIQFGDTFDYLSSGLASTVDSVGKYSYAGLQGVGDAVVTVGGKINDAASKSGDTLSQLFNQLTNTNVYLLIGALIAVSIYLGRK